MNKNTNIEQINAQYGRVPPQAVEVEEAVIGSFMLEADAYKRMSAYVSPASFYKDEHQKICQAIHEIADSGNDVDLLQVTQKLKDKDELNEVGGPGYVTGLTSSVASAANLEFHVKIIAQKHIQRELIRISQETQNFAYDDSRDVQDTLEELRDKLHKIEGTGAIIAVQPEEAINDIYDRIKKNLESTSDITGAPTGLSELDLFMGGLQLSDFTIIAGEPGQGKTSLLITIGRSLSLNMFKFGMISLEMPPIQIYTKFLSQETGIPGKRILNSKLENNEIRMIDDVKEKFINMDLYVDPSHSNTLNSVVASIRHMHRKYGVCHFGVDYIQRMATESKRSTTEEMLGTIAKTFKNLCKELNIHIVALSQLSKDDRKDHYPTMSRLRGSGQLQEAPDNIIFVYRPEEYGIDFINEEIPSQNKAQIILAKGRNVGTFEMIADFENQTGIFKNQTSFDDFAYNPDQFTEPGFE